MKYATQLSFILMSVVSFSPGTVFARDPHARSVAGPLSVRPMRSPHLERIRNLLAEDILKFCRVPSVQYAIQSGGAPRALNELKETIRSSQEGRDGEALLYSAITLALFNDGAGALILEHAHSYYSTQSEIEDLHVAAATILLGRQLGPVSEGVNWRTFSPLLTQEVVGRR